MSDARFDPSSAVTFDLAHGIVLLDGAAPRVLVPAEALAALCATASPEAVATFGRALGQSLGRRVASRLAPSEDGDAGAGVRAATVELVVEHLGGELALAGLGTLGIERWGRALVLVIDQSPFGAAGDALLAAVLEGATHAATGRRVAVGLLARDEVRARFLSAGADAVERVRGWLAAGSSWGEALARLHAPPRPAASAGGEPARRDA